MPDLTITAEQRAAIYPEIRRHLTTIDRVRELADTEPKEAQIVAMEYTVWFALLEDLGWEEEDDRESIRLTVTATGLRPVLQPLLSESVSTLRDEVEHQGDDERRRIESRDQKIVVREACRFLLKELDDRAPEDLLVVSAPESSCHD
jgi:hypothetical protein